MDNFRFSLGLLFCVLLQGCVTAVQKGVPTGQGNEVRTIASVHLGPITHVTYDGLGTAAENTCFEPKLLAEKLKVELRKAGFEVKTANADAVLTVKIGCKTRLGIYAQLFAIVNVEVGGKFFYRMTGQAGLVFPWSTVTDSLTQKLAANMSEDFNKKK